MATTLNYKNRSLFSFQSYWSFLSLPTNRVPDIPPSAPPFNKHYFRSVNRLVSGSRTRLWHAWRHVVSQLCLYFALRLHFVFNLSVLVISSTNVIGVLPFQQVQFCWENRARWKLRKANGTLGAQRRPRVLFRGRDFVRFPAFVKLYDGACVPFLTPFAALICSTKSSTINGRIVNLSLICGEYPENRIDKFLFWGLFISSRGLSTP